MARGVSQKNRKQRGKAPGKVRHNIKFIFDGREEGDFSPDYISELSGKIKNEYSSRAGICYIHRGGIPQNLETRHIRYLDMNSAGREEIHQAIDGDYLVLLDQGTLSRQINPNEFFQLELPEDPRQKRWYEISFHGKKSIEGGGIIIPAGVLQYIITISDHNEFPEPDFIRLVLQKLGFEQKDVSIHQDAPMDKTGHGKSLLMKKLLFGLKWYTILPVKEWRSPETGKHYFNKEHPLFRLAFFITALAIFIILPMLSLDAGLSGDDEKHYNHAIKVYQYYTEDNPAALDDPKYKLNYYGQSFDFFTYLIIRLFNLEDNPYQARHVMIALTGAGAILVTGLLVKMFAGYSAGWLALILMFLSPRFLGHSFNNPMDIPFAFGYIFTIYHIILFLKKLPRISINSAIWIAIGIGWTNGIRIGGLILIPYLFMFAGLYLLIHRWQWKFFSAAWWRFALKGLGILILISLAGYMLSLLTWPYALQDIVNNPIQAFKIMTNIQVSIRVLYDGLVQWSDHLPWHYIPKNILITVPVIILLGFVASIFIWIADRKSKQGFWYFLLWFTVLFPLLFIIYRKSNVYGGWRHMMFVYPSMLALAAIALSSIIRTGHQKWIRYTVILVIAAGVIHPLRHILKNHPNTYIYFNEWSGGINNTYGKFETDYYCNSLRPASDYFIEHILPAISADQDQPVRVVSNANINYYFRNYMQEVIPFYSRYYDRGKYDWDYAILYCNYIHPFQLNNGLWPPVNTVHEIKVDDVVVAAIVERRNRDDYLGSKLLAEGVKEENGVKLEQAINYLESALEYNKNNESALLEIGSAYAVTLRFDDARAAMDSLLKIYPDYDKAYNLKGYTYMIESEVRRDRALLDDAIRYINKAIQSNYKFYSGFYNLGLCYGMKNDRVNAEYNLKMAIRYNSKFLAAYEKLAELYEYYGNQELANSVRAQLNRLR